MKAYAVHTIVVVDESAEFGVHTYTKKPRDMGPCGNWFTRFDMHWGENAIVELELDGGELIWIPWCRVIRMIGE